MLATLQLMEELLEAIEQRDAGDPDGPAWEACARIQRLEAELARRLNERASDAGAASPPGIAALRTDEAFAGIA